jgi:hypothetical protein
MIAISEVKGVLSYEKRFFKGQEAAVELQGEPK